MSKHHDLSRSSRAGRALLAAVSLLGLPPLAVGQSGLTAAPSSGPRAMFVWDTTIPANRNETKSAIGFALRHRIDTIYLEAGPVGYLHMNARDDYKRFVDLAHARGLEVYALIGNPWFTVPADAGVPGQATNQLEGFNVYRQLTQSKVAFDGVVDISMPYLTDYDHEGASGNWFLENLPYSAQDYLDYLRGVELVIGDLPFHCAVPFWFDSDPRFDLTLEASLEPRPLNAYVADIADVSVVLAYRDRAQGPDGILQLSLGELLTGPAVVGIETLDQGALWSYLTFWEEGCGVLEQELFKVWYAHRANPNFRGFVLHEYRSYLQLAE